MRVRQEDDRVFRQCGTLAVAARIVAIVQKKPPRRSEGQRGPLAGRRRLSLAMKKRWREGKMKKFHLVIRLNCLLNRKISSASARGKIRSPVPQTQGSASSPGLALGIAMAF